MSISGDTVSRTVGLTTTGVSYIVGPGQLRGYYVATTDTIGCSIKVYDKASAPLASDSPALTITLPASGAANLTIFDGIDFVRGLGVRASALAADSDTTAVTAGAVVCNMFSR